MKSSQYYQENTQGERLQEGWNTVTPKEIKYISTSKGDCLLIKVGDEEGRVATDFLYDNGDHNARIAQLAEIGGVTWNDGAPGDEVAKLLNESIFTLNVRVKWGQGDKCFIQEYGPAGAQKPTTQPQAQPTQAAPATNGRSGRRF